MIKVISHRELSENEKAQIADIFEHSNCPHESLTNSIEGYEGIDGNIITIGGEDEVREYEL
jgi:hypothetical protein